MKIQKNTVFTGFSVHISQLQFLDPTGSLAFTLLVGKLVGWLVTTLLNCKLLNLET